MSTTSPVPVTITFPADRFYYTDRPLDWKNRDAAYYAHEYTIAVEGGPTATSRLPWWAAHEVLKQVFPGQDNLTHSFTIRVNSLTPTVSRRPGKAKKYLTVKATLRFDPTLNWEDRERASWSGAFKTPPVGKYILTDRPEMIAGCQYRNCDWPLHAKGYCKPHYTDVYQGNPFRKLTKWADNTDYHCAAEGCTHLRYVNGYCKKHVDCGWAAQEADTAEGDYLRAKRLGCSEEVVEIARLKWEIAKTEVRIVEKRVNARLAAN